MVATAEAPACYRGKFRNQLRRQWRQADAAGIVVESTHEVALLDRFYDEVLVPNRKPSGSSGRSPPVSAEG